MKVLLPPARLGIMGSGQLGRMFTQRALEKGYSVSVYSPESNTPAGKVGANEFVGSYTDFIALRNFLDNIDSLSFEFENIPDETLRFLETYANKYSLRIHPSPESIRISQNRNTEKKYFQKIGIPTTKFKTIGPGPFRKSSLRGLRLPIIMKTIQFGYDGKGQKKFETPEDLEEYLKEGITEEYILEEVILFDREVSVIGARIGGKNFIYPPSENIHRNHILDQTIHPANISPGMKKKLIGYTELLLEKLDYTGVLGFEFFIRGRKIFANEFAPRPHNSGHYTQNAANFSQFEMQLFAMTDVLPLSKLKTQNCTMKNIVGGNFFQKEDLQKYLNSENVYLHLYGKDEIREGRKMGHINIVGNSDKLNFDF